MLPVALTLSRVSFYSIKLLIEAFAANYKNLLSITSLLADLDIDIQFVFAHIGIHTFSGKWLKIDKLGTLSMEKG
ncbi:MAG: hypothetical protein ACXVLF_11175 [Flavisolibacter sp.]